MRIGLTLLIVMAIWAPLALLLAWGLGRFLKDVDQTPPLPEAWRRDQIRRDGQRGGGR